jgi:signal recognition particle GTPase
MFVTLLININMDVMFNIVETVRIDEATKEVIELLEWGSEKNVVAVILLGIDGIGKTTLGDVVFSLANFEGCEYSL